MAGSIYAAVAQPGRALEIWEGVPTISVKLKGPGCNPLRYRGIVGSNPTCGIFYFLILKHLTSNTERGYTNKQTLGISIDLTREELQINTTNFRGISVDLTREELQINTTNFRGIGVDHTIEDGC